MHKCSKCGRTEEEIEFYLRTSGRPQSRCVPCHKEQVKSTVDPDKKRDRAREASRRLREKLNTLKSAPCTDCGRVDLPFLMDFDHRDAKDKLFNIGSSLNLGEKKIMAEVAKCDVVCCRCHRIRTHTRRARR